MVDQLVDILKIIDKASSVEQVTDVPKIFLDSTPQRAVLRASQHVVEQLVDVPKPVLTDAEGRLWFSLVGTGGSTGGCGRLVVVVCCVLCCLWCVGVGVVML